MACSGVWGVPWHRIRAHTWEGTSVQFACSAHGHGILWHICPGLSARRRPQVCCSPQYCARSFFGWSSAPCMFQYGPPFLPSARGIHRVRRHRHHLSCAGLMHAGDIRPRTADRILLRYLCRGWRHDSRRFCPEEWPCYTEQSYCLAQPEGRIQNHLLHGYHHQPVLVAGRGYSALHSCRHLSLWPGRNRTWHP